MVGSEVQMSKDLIKVIDGELVVSSREVANNFGKHHKNVLEKIDNLINDLGSTTEKSALFISTTYVASNGKSNKEYLLTRDGFSLIVMGFTGTKALNWKLKYIEAFNNMENALRDLVPTLSEEQKLKLKFIDCTTTEGIIIHKQLVEYAKEETRKEERNGNNKIINLSTLVLEIGIDGLTTTMFNEWLCQKGLGKMVVYQGNKNRSFMPNEKFFELIATEGYSLTGQTLNGRVKVVYSTRMVEYANENIDDLLAYVQSQI